MRISALPLRRLASLGLFLLAACSGQDVKETLGIERNAPDEYRVVSRPPLSVPPEFELRPPLPGESELPTLPADKLAHSLLTGEAAPTPTGTQLPTAATAVKPVESTPVQSQGDARFLSNLGTDKADPAIRDKVYQDKLDTDKKNDKWYTINPEDVKKEEMVDPAKEAKRLKEQNVPVNAPSPNDAKSSQ